MADTDQNDLTTLTVELLSAYVSNNQVPSTELAGLIQSTRAALSSAPEIVEPTKPEFTPAVTVRKSLASDDHILSMIDGKPYKTLKRHLATHGLTPLEYLERYKLPKGYPMVAKSYSDARRAVAQRLGLGRKASITETPKKAVATVVEAPPKAATVKAPKKTSTQAGVATKSRATKAAISKPETAGTTTNVAKPRAKAKTAGTPPAAESSAPMVAPAAKKVRVRKTGANDTTTTITPTTSKKAPPRSRAAAKRTAPDPAVPSEA
jgi:predicted transcriptional regulator